MKKRAKALYSQCSPIYFCDIYMSIRKLIVLDWICILYERSIEGLKNFFEDSNIWLGVAVCFIGLFILGLLILYIFWFTQNWITASIPILFFILFVFAIQFFNFIGKKLYKE